MFSVKCVVIIEQRFNVYITSIGIRINILIRPIPYHNSRKLSFKSLNLASEAGLHLILGVSELGGSAYPLDLPFLFHFLPPLPSTVPSACSALPLYIYIYMCVCVCVCVFPFTSVVQHHLVPNLTPFTVIIRGKHTYRPPDLVTFTIMAGRKPTILPLERKIEVFEAVESGKKQTIFTYAFRIPAILDRHDFYSYFFLVDDG